MSTIKAKFELALQYYQEQQWAEAEKVCHQALKEAPEQPDIWHLLGVIQFQNKQIEEAISAIKQAISIAPNLPHYYHSLANVQLIDDKPSAVKSLKKALDLKPDWMDLYAQLGILLKEEERLSEAIELYKKAMTINQNLPGIHYNLANLYKMVDEKPLAISHYKTALKLQPQFAEAHFNLGNALREQGKLELALDHFQLAAEMTPEDLSTLYQCASLAQDLGMFYLANIHYQNILKLNPSHLPSLRNYGLCLHAINELDEALKVFQKWKTLDLDNSQPYVNIANIFREQGQSDLAFEHYQQSVKLSNEIGDKIKLALYLPPIYKSQEDLLYWRERVEQEVEDILSQKYILKDPFKEVGVTNFYLAYQGYNDVFLQQKIAQIYRPFLPEDMVSTQGNARTKIGFISGFFYNQSVSHYYAPMIQSMPSEEFEVLLFATPNMKQDHITQQLQSAASEFIRLPANLEEARQLISNKGLDILVYTDIGMEPFTYFLSFTRMAPIQCVLNGHPVTSGINTIDYFLSCDLMEPSNAQEHYSEKLITLRGIPADYPKSKLPEKCLTRKDLNLPLRGNLYVCPMTLFKMHPEFDIALGNILKEDPEGYIILFKYQQTKLHEQLLTRFQQTIPDYKRIIFMPWCNWDSFMSLLHMADVVLDTFYFSGANTAFMVLSLTTPMLTWPSQFMRGKLCHGMYNRMNYHDCVASSQEEYVQKAIQIANNKSLNQEIRHQIQKKSAVLFHNPEGVEDMIRFYQKISSA